MPSALTWKIAGAEILLDRPRILGVLNVTPDSFSDGGRCFSFDEAVERGVSLAAEGADVIDVGGESTRPQGATAVETAEELRRVVPVIAELRRRLPSVPISVDTVKSEVARAALDAGALIVNDVSALRLDERMPGVCAAAGAGVILMHSRGTVTDMGTYAHALYEDVVREVMNELQDGVALALRSGIDEAAIALDPGLGFAKRSEHSLAMLAALPALVELGFPVVIGASRKRFIGEITGVVEPAGRVAGTVGANVAALERGVRLFRVHDVASNRQALDVAWAIQQRSLVSCQ